MPPSFSEKHESTLIARRTFLRGITAAFPLAYVVGHGHGLGLGAALALEPPGDGGLIVRQKDPDNLESRFAKLDRFITPTEQFYIRNHFKAPEIDLHSWRLRVESAVPP